MRKVLAFDLGGTKFAFGVVNEDGTVLGSGRVETFAEKGPQQACERVAAAARRHGKFIMSSGIFQPFSDLVAEGTQVFNIGADALALAGELVAGGAGF